MKRCKDCISEGVVALRATPHPGPRCTTHHRKVLKERRAKTHDLRVVATYGLAPGEYEQLYRFQGNVCAGCLRAKGTGRKKLAVDHDHGTGEVRGLLCSTCNQVLGHFRDDPEALRRLASYLEDPPKRRMEKQ